MQCEEGAEMRVDSKATMPNDFAWEGQLRVEIPIEPDVQAHGGEMNLILVGRGEQMDWGSFGYPGPKSPDWVKRSSPPADGR
jgi:hypothetical protein